LWPVYVVVVLSILWMCASYGSRAVPGWIGVGGGILLSPALALFLPLIAALVDGWTAFCITALIVWLPWPVLGFFSTICDALIAASIDVAHQPPPTAPAS
jgi:hypothetical protein